MPSFECCGTQYQFSQKDLDRAPQSVLTEAWAASEGEAVISLEAWPAQDPDAFDVWPCSKWRAKARGRRQLQNNGLVWLQVVVDSLKAQYSEPGRRFQSLRAVRALDYFAVPLQLWPAGLQVLQSTNIFMQEAASDIVQQLSQQILQLKPKEALANCMANEKHRFNGQFELLDSIKDSSSYLVTKHIGRGSDVNIPAALKEAIVKAGRCQHLLITFEVIKFYRLYMNVTVSPDP